MIANCTCQHEYQDRKYGKGKRVFNETNDGGGRCTVCGYVKGGSSPLVKKEKGKK